MKTSLEIKTHHFHPHFKGGEDKQAEAKRPNQLVTPFFLYYLCVFSGFTSEIVVLPSYQLAFTKQTV